MLPAAPTLPTSTANKNNLVLPQLCDITADLHDPSSSLLPTPPPPHTANKNNLELRSNSPQWVYSTAPLVKPDGTPVDGPQAGAAGYAMSLNDAQVRGDG